MKMDRTTKAFSQLWDLYKKNHDIKTTADWDKLVDDAGEIVESSQDSEDPQIIKEFAVSIINSIERIQKRNGFYYNRE